jgi:hypothetical protein
MDLRPAGHIQQVQLHAPHVAGRSTQGAQQEVGSSSAGMNRIKFVGFAGLPEFLQASPISAHQHTPERCGV